MNKRLSDNRHSILTRSKSKHESWNIWTSHPRNKVLIKRAKQQIYEIVRKVNWDKKFRKVNTNFKTFVTT